MQPVPDQQKSRVPLTVAGQLKVKGTLIKYEIVTDNFDWGDAVSREDALKKLSRISRMILDTNWDKKK